MATDINRVIIVGRLTRDADLTMTQSGLAITKLSIAVNRSKKQGDAWVEEAHFFDATLIGRRGEALKPHLRQGLKVTIEGRLRQERWEQDGAKRSRVSIDVDEISLPGRSMDGAENSGGRASFSPQASAPRSVPSTPPPVFPDDTPFDDSDIPF